jgi:RNA polymerase sigma factor (sigma-70 family)
MNDQGSLTRRFEANRPRLRGVAYRMLGSLSEAEDAVQEAWLRLNRVDAAGVDNLEGWLTTVVSRVCLDTLRSRRTRREESIEEQVGDPGGANRESADPENEAILADSVGVALLVVLDTLSPAERLAFVLHDLFDRPFEEIGPIVGRSAEAARQLASRARRRVRGGSAGSGVQRERQSELVAAFLTATRTGDLDALLAVLDPDAVVRIDAAARINAPPDEVGKPREVRGAKNWAAQLLMLAGGMRSVQTALIDGDVGLVVAADGKLNRVLKFSFADSTIQRLEVIADAERLRKLDVAVL